MLSSAERERYARALVKSVQVDPSPPLKGLPNICTANDLATDGLELDLQYKWRVCALKPVALEFLLGLGIPERGLNAKLTWRNYEKRFGQAPVFIHQKPLIMMLSFAEWLHLVVDRPSPLEIPLLSSYLRSDTSPLRQILLETHQRKEITWHHSHR